VKDLLFKFYENYQFLTKNIVYNILITVKIGSGIEFPAIVKAIKEERKF
jgi:hypothetical protein